MDISVYQALKRKIHDTEHAYLIKKWQNVQPCDAADEFFRQYAWVVINTGLKNQVAQVIYDRIVKALYEGATVASAFGHQRKARAIENMHGNRQKIFDQYLRAGDKLKFLEELPEIGKITKYHLARNLGIDVCKPDRHLVRIANQYSTTPHDLCNKLAEESGDRIGVVDYVLWRSANLKLL